MPEVSVIIPVFNVEKYLKQCLNSLVNQTLENIEIVCIDDGSTDSSGKICDEYARNDARVKVIHKKNSGYGSSINVGIDNAEGKYIGILEPDDFASFRMYEDLWNIAEKFQADNVRCNWYEYFSAKDISVNAGTISPLISNKIITYKKHHDILKNKTMIWAGILKKEFLTKQNIRCLETPGASYQDTSFNFKILSLAERLVLVDKPYVYYRKDSMNSSVKNKGKVYCICDEYKEITNFLEEHPDIKSEVNYMKLIDEYNNYVWNLMRISGKYRSEFTDRFADIFKEYYDNNELDGKFFRKVNKKEVKILLNNKEDFSKVIDKYLKKKEAREKRKRIFSLKMSLSRLCLVLLGQPVINISK